MERGILGIAGLVVLVAPYDTMIGLLGIAGALAVTVFMFVRGRTRAAASRANA
jgi:hypothetical protein